MEEPTDKDNESQADDYLARDEWQEARREDEAARAWLRAHRDEHRAQMAAWREEQKAYWTAQFSRASSGEGNPHDVLTTAQVAGLYGVTPQSIRNMIHKGELPASRIDHEEPGRWHYGIRRGDLDPKCLPREMTPEEIAEYYGDNNGKPYRESDMLTVDEVAKLCGTGRGTIYRQIRSGELPAVRNSRGHWRIKRGHLWSWDQCPPGILTVEEERRREAEARRRAEKGPDWPATPEQRAWVKEKVAALRESGFIELTDEEVDARLDAWGHIEVMSWEDAKPWDLEHPRHQEWLKGHHVDGW